MFVILLSVLMVLVFVSSAAALLVTRLPLHIIGAKAARKKEANCFLVESRVLLSVGNKKYLFEKETVLLLTARLKASMVLKLEACFLSPISDGSYFELLEL